MPVLGHNRNLDHIIIFPQSFFEKDHLNSGVRLLLELYCVMVIKHVTFFTSWAKLLVKVAFT